MHISIRKLYQYRFLFEMKLSGKVLSNSLNLILLFILQPQYVDLILPTLPNLPTLVQDHNL